MANSTSSSWSYVFSTVRQHRVHGRITDKDGGFTDYWVIVMIT